MSDDLKDAPCKTPIQDLLRSIPKTERYWYETDDNGFKVSHHCPVGLLAHEAADTIDSQAAELGQVRQSYAHVCEQLPEAQLRALHAETERDALRGELSRLTAEREGRVHAEPDYRALAERLAELLGQVCWNRSDAAIAEARKALAEFEKGRK